MATLTADLLDASVNTRPAAAAPTAHTAEAPKPLSFHQSPVAQALEQQRLDAHRRAIEGVPEYKIKDVTNEFHSAHEMGVQRGKFQIANANRDTDADWRAEHGQKGGFIEASSQHAEEAAMNANEVKAYHAAREAGWGDAWKEAFNLGKEQAVRHAEYEGMKDLATAGVKMLAKDAVGLVTEGPVGEAMMVRDAATLASRAPTIAATVGVSAAGAAAWGLAKAYMNAEMDHAKESLTHSLQEAGKGLGMSQGTMNAIGDSVSKTVNHVSDHIDAFRAKEYAALDAGDRKTAELSQAATNAVAPVTTPVSHAVETVTAPVTHSFADALKPLGDSVSKAFDSVMNKLEGPQHEAFKKEFISLLENRGSQSLSHEEVQQVFKELAHVEKGDRLVVENHAIHLVPAGAKMPDFPPGAMVLDANQMREGLGIERAPAPAAHPATYAQAPTPAHGIER